MKVETMKATYSHIFPLGSIPICDTYICMYLLSMSTINYKKEPISLIPKSFVKHTNLNLIMGRVKSSGSLSKKKKPLNKKGDINFPHKYDGVAKVV